MFSVERHRHKGSSGQPTASCVQVYAGHGLVHAKRRVTEAIGARLLVPVRVYYETGVRTDRSGIL